MAQPRPLDVGNWQHSCPECGYENGFHVSFRQASAGKAEGEVAVWLICPSCSAVFDVGLRVRPDTVPRV